MRNQVAPHPATLAADRGELQLVGGPGVEVRARFTISELGGQEGPTGVLVSVSDLVTAAGATIPATDVILDVPSNLMEAGAALDVRLMIPIPADASGEFTGEIEITSDQTKRLVVPVTVRVTNRWQNPANRFDVDGADGVTAQDVLLLINYINGQPGDSFLPASPQLPPPYYDVNADDACTAQDVSR